MEVNAINRTLPMEIEDMIAKYLKNDEFWKDHLEIENKEHRSVLSTS